jgi:hypothetical protein
LFGDVECAAQNVSTTVNIARLVSEMSGLVRYGASNNQSIEFS